MNILHVTPYYAPAWAYGGVVQAVTGLAQAQAARGHRVMVLTTDTLDRGRRVRVQDEQTGGVEIIRVPNLFPGLRHRLNLSTPPGFGQAADRLLLANAVDVIHCHELRTLENVLIAPRARRADVPTVVSPHGTLPYHTGRGLAKMLWDQTLGWRLLRAFDLVVCVTDREAVQARGLWPRLGVDLPDERIALIPNGVDTIPAVPAQGRVSFREHWGLGNGAIILFLGRLEARKRLPLLISAFATITQEFPEARLLVVGPDEGSLQPMTALTERLRLQARVIFTGLLVGMEKAAALAAADLLVLPSSGEGQSMAALEALASGLPAVLTEGGGFEEAIAAGAAVLAEPEVVSLAAVIRVLLADGPRRIRMGKKGRELVRTHYSWRQVAARMDEAYETARHRKGRA